jgi:diguanylate cyclase (GGDEF)-like protein/PAS domain S-box-containing protein
MGRRLPRRKNQTKIARRQGNAQAISAGPAVDDPVFDDVAFAKAGLELAERQAGYGAWFWNLPTDSFYMTPNACAVLGVEEGVTKFDEIMASIHEEDREEVVSRVREHLDAREAYDLAFRIRRPDGEVRWIRSRGHVSTDAEGEPAMFAGSIEDTTHQVETLNELQRSELRFRSLIESAPFPVVITRPRDKTLRYVNQRAVELLDELGKPSDTLSVPDLMSDKETYEELRAQLLAKGVTDNFEMSLQRADGTPLWILIKGLIIDYEGEPCAYLILLDVTERRELEEKLRVQATSDSLTGVANRAELLDQLEFAISVSNRTDEGFALLLLDLDNFKMVNDTRGHSVGDKLLVEASKRLHKLVRTTDTVARIGGDEFAIIARHLDQTRGVTVLAQKIIDALGEPFEIDGVVANVGCSIGIAHYPWDKGDPELLMQNADLALYRAKDEGRGCFQLFDEELSRAVHERMDLEHDLRIALDTDQFFVMYQPRFDAETREPVAGEALARWNHPDKGLISPGLFIPIAEETGLVIDLGRVVLGHVVSDIARWRDEGLDVGPMSVNISPIHLAAGCVLEDVFGALKKYDVPAHCLQVEVTESAMITDEESASSQIKALADGGIEILIDDFGTGYSSLSYLHRFTAHELKIDRSFVSNVADATSAILARQIVSIGKSLDLKIVAEGVETDAQADFMTAIGCDELQGFLLSRPIEAPAFEDLMRARQARAIAKEA